MKDRQHNPPVRHFLRHPTCGLSIRQITDPDRVAFLIYYINYIIIIIYIIIYINT